MFLSTSAFSNLSAILMKIVPQIHKFFSELCLVFVMQQILGPCVKKTNTTNLLRIGLSRRNDCGSHIFINPFVFSHILYATRLNFISAVLSKCLNTFLFVDLTFKGMLSIFFTQLNSFKAEFHNF